MGRGECKRTCFRRERHRAIIALACKRPQQETCPATCNHDGEQSARRVDDGAMPPAKKSLTAVKSSAAPMSSTTQQLQHSPKRPKKSMLLVASINIKVIYLHALVVAIARLVWPGGGHFLPLSQLAASNARLADPSRRG